MATPAAFVSSSPYNPSTLSENRTAFEALLAHNRSAKIVWTHIGWDNTAHMTVGVLRDMLKRNSNLYMGIKMLDSPGPVQFLENRPLDENGVIRAEWLSLISDYSDRFLLGSDEFVGSEAGNSAGAPSTKGTWSILSQLTASVARIVACDNPAKIYRLP